MSTLAPDRTSDVSKAARPPGRRQTAREGIALLIGIVALMWIVEIVNTIDGNRLDGDGIYARNVAHLWGILTAPFIHASFQHLIDNTIPFVFMGVIIALAGATRLLLVTAIVVAVGGIGTWLISPGGVATIGASGVVFGYATYLLVRGFFDRSALELLTGVIVGVLWGGVLLTSLVPHTGISWQGHLCGAIGGVVAAWLLSGRRAARRDAARPGGQAAATLPK